MYGSFAAYPGYYPANGAPKRSFQSFRLPPVSSYANGTFRYYNSYYGQPQQAYNSFSQQVAPVGPPTNPALTPSATYSPVVAVTGASGFVASMLIKKLLKDGYTVRGTVRDPTAEAKVRHLTSLPGAPERLTLHKADLMDEESFDAVFAGCVGVFHTASPFFTDGDEASLVEPAVRGTENVLNACLRAGVTRVVVTSSTAAVGFNGGKLGPEHVYTDQDWSDEALLRERGIWYPLSKTAAERTVWEFAQAHPEVKITVVNPTLVVGPSLQPNLNTSSALILGWLNGSKTEISNGTTGIVDVRDVATLHVKAFQRDIAINRRYLAFSASLPNTKLCEILRTIAPNASIPSDVAEGEPAKPMLVDTSPARELGVVFRSPQSSLTDTVNSLRQNGHFGQ